MAERLSGQTGVRSSNTRFQVLVDVDGAGDAWHQIPGASGFSYSNGERPINETEIFGGTYTETGELTKPSLDITIASYIPHSPVMNAILDRFEDEDTLDVRWLFPAKTVVRLTTGNVTVSIDTSGVATFQNLTSSQSLELASDRVVENMSIFVGAAGSQSDYVIRTKTIAANGTLTNMSVVDAATGAVPASAVSAANFGIRNPALQTPSLNCDIMNAGNEDGSSSTAGLGSALSLRGRHTLGRKVIVSNP